MEERGAVEGQAEAIEAKATEATWGKGGLEGKAPTAAAAEVMVGAAEVMVRAAAAAGVRVGTVVPAEGGSRAAGDVPTCGDQVTRR